MSDLFQQWLDAKAAEKAATDNRRDIEDELLKQFNPEFLEGSKKYNIDGYSLKVTKRVSRKVNADELQTLAAEAGLSDHLSSLFRWSPAINMAQWKAADQNITDKLLPAITITPARPSVAIERKIEE